MSKAEKTRQFILEKTAPIFNSKGFAGTSLSDLTEATGLTKGSIYGNFENKDEVALAAFDHNWKSVQAVMRAEMDKRKTYKEKLLAYVRIHENAQAPALPVGGCPLLNTAVEADDTHPALREKAAAAFLGWKKNIVALIEGGIAAKEFRRQVDAGQTALSLIALIEGAILISRLTGQAQHRKAVLPAAEKIIQDLS
jgi:TetR/AcrR family transcriptional repressor of nem operon